MLWFQLQNNFLSTWYQNFQLPKHQQLRDGDRKNSPTFWCRRRRRSPLVPGLCFHGNQCQFHSQIPRHQRSEKEIGNTPLPSGAGAAAAPPSGVGRQSGHNAKQCMPNYRHHHTLQSEDAGKQGKVSPGNSVHNLRHCKQISYLASRAAWQLNPSHAPCADSSQYGSFSTRQTTNILHLQTRKKEIGITALPSGIAAAASSPQHLHTRRYSPKNFLSPRHQSQKFVF